MAIKMVCMCVGIRVSLYCWTGMAWRLGGFVQVASCCKSKIGIGETSAVCQRLPIC